MKWYVATVRRQKGTPKTGTPFQAENIRDAAAHIRETHGLWGKDPHNGFQIDETAPVRRKIWAK